MNIPEGIIDLGTEAAKELGFDEQLFEGYLWKTDNAIIISFIISKKPRNGNLSRLFNNILNMRYSIKVPTPFKLMETILIKKGFTKTHERSDYFQEDVEIWIKHAESSRILQEMK